MWSSSCAIERLAHRLCQVDSAYSRAARTTHSSVLRTAFADLELPLPSPPPPLPSPFPPLPASYDSDLFLLYFPSIGMKWLEMKGGFDGYQQTVDYLLSQLP